MTTRSMMKQTDDNDGKAMDVEYNCDRHTTNTTNYKISNNLGLVNV